MGIATLVIWILTAGGGFFMLAKWVAGGGHRQPSNTRFPPALIFGHFVLAVAGLVLWILYLLLDNDALGWAAFIVLIPVALLGFTMLARWIPVYRQATVPAGTGRAAAATNTTGNEPAERSFPVVVVAAHGVLAVATLVLALLTMLGVGAS
jgi:hypothetical protein